VSISTDELLDRSRLPGGFPRCRDQDDDLFVSLAFHGKADALVSRDHAVLRLRTRAKQYGVEILDIPGMIAKLEAQACERRRGQPAM
jgi:predicted nucleic acid-binding protein